MLSARVLRSVAFFSTEITVYRSPDVFEEKKKIDNAQKSSLGKVGICGSNFLCTLLRVASGQGGWGKEKISLLTSH